VSAPRIGPANGYVEPVTLRTTVIRGATGALCHVPNSHIDRVTDASMLQFASLSSTPPTDKETEVLLFTLRDTADNPDWWEVAQRSTKVSGVQELCDDFVGTRVIVHAPEQAVAK